MTINASRIGIVGGSGSGKSTRAKAMTKAARRCVAFDPLDEYAQEGFKRFDSLPALGKHIAANLRDFRACYVPRAGAEVAALSKLSFMLKDLQAGYKAGLHRAQLHFLIEEMNISFPSSMAMKEHPGFGDLCSRGRHWGINLIGVSQRPNEINTRFRGNLEHLYVFRLIDHVDIQSLVAALGKEYATKIKTLKPHEYYYRGLDGVVKKGKNRLP